MPAKPRNLLRLLEQQASAFPGRVALIDDDRQWSFAELDGAVARYAGALTDAAGLRTRDRLGVCLKDTADHLIARLAAARAGITVVPMDWRVPLRERATVAQDFRLAAVLTAPDALIDDVRCIPVDAAWQSRVAAAHELPFADDPDLPLVLNLSSGTTGTPKAAVVTHRNYAARIRNNVMAFGSVEGLRYLSASPLYFSAGSHYCLTTLLQGCTVILYPPLFSAEEYVDAVLKYQATMAFLVPTVLRWLLALPNTGQQLLPTLQILLATAAPLTAHERRLIVQRLTPNLYEIYGSAAGGGLTSLRPDDLARHADTVGRADGNVELQVVDDSGRLSPSGVVGRVRVRGPGVATAWFHSESDSGSDNDAAYSECFQDGWNYTGDLGVLDADRYLTLLGRTDDVILRGGANIYPDVVEAALRRYPGVADAAVVGRPVNNGDPEVLAFAIADASVSEQLLFTHCRNVLPAWMLPAEIRFVDELPRTTSGKVRRRDLLSS